jgi:hypothetical protein
MEVNDLQERDFVIPVTEAFEHAVFALVRAIAAAVPDVGSWSKAAVGPTPAVIHDINGALLFYDFDVRNAEVLVGYIRSAANELVGAPTVAFEIGARHWNFDLAAERLSAKVREEFPDAQIGPARLVCYGYPKLGMLFDINGNARAIYDVVSLNRVPEHSDRDREGSYAWSFLDSLSDKERATRLERYRQFDLARLEAISPEARAEIVETRSVERAVRSIAPHFEQTITRKLQYCGHYDTPEARAHHCFALHGQKFDDACAVATCQMVLCYYRYDYAHGVIAPALAYEYGAGCPADHSEGYKKLTCAHLEATFHDAPTWATAQSEIDARRPFKSGVSAHARACAGYSSTAWRFGLVEIVERKLYIYDPSPSAANLQTGGSTYWEDWDSIPHTNYVTARIKCP